MSKKMNCIECGKSFEAQRSSAKFCSPNCRVKWNNRDDDQELKDVAQPATPKLSTPKMAVKSNGELTLKPSDEKLKKLKETMDLINKDYGEGSVMMMGGTENSNVEVIPTGSLFLNMALGVGGYPKGRIIEIYGQESSGKTTLAIHAIAEAQKLGGKCAMIDAEHAFDKSYAEALGVKVDDLYISQPDYGEQALEIADRLILSGAFSIVVIDSVAALVPKTELQGEMGDSKMGLHARLMSQALRKMTGTISKTKTVLIFINQLREKIGIVYGSPYVTTGGNALKFFASIRLDVAKSANGKMMDGEEQFGTKTKVKVVKNKVAPPFKMAEFDIIFGEGIDYVGEVVDAAAEYKIIQKAGSWYSYKGSNIAQGREATKKFFKDNEEVLKEIIEKLPKH
jgi:recombination protein RecA